MSNASVIIKMQANDELTPALKKAQEQLEKFDKVAQRNYERIRQLKNAKGLILEGKFDTGVESITSLQSELALLRQKSSELKKQNASVKEQNSVLREQKQVQKQIQAELNHLIGLYETRYRRALRYKQEASKSVSLEIENIRKNTKATDENSKSQNRANAILQKATAIRNSNINALVRHIRQIETLVFSIYGLKKAYDATLGSGIELHRQIENQTAGIAALVTANTRMASGNTDLAKHFNASMRLSEQTIKQIKKAAIETAATFPELTAIFQQAIGGALGAGSSMGKNISEQIKNTIDIAQKCQILPVLLVCQWHKSMRKYAQS